MADRRQGPPPDLTVMEKNLAISQQRVNIQSMEYRKAQLAAEMDQIDVNIAAAEDHIAELTAEIETLTHPAEEPSDV